MSWVLAWLRVFFLDVAQLGGDVLAHLDVVADFSFQVGDFLLQILDFLDSIDYIFAVQIAQLYFGDVFGLHLVDAEALHQIRDDVGFDLGLAYNLYRLVDIEQNLPESEQKVQLLLLL